MPQDLYVLRAHLTMRFCYSWPLVSNVRRIGQSIND